MDHYARAVISSMFLRRARRDGDGVFGDLGREPVVGSKGFLLSSADILQVCGGRVTLQFRQWQRDVRASSGEARSRSYWI